MRRLLCLMGLHRWGKLFQYRWTQEDGAWYEPHRSCEVCGAAHRRGSRVTPIFRPGSFYIEKPPVKCEPIYVPEAWREDFRKVLNPVVEATQEPGGPIMLKHFDGTLRERQ